MNYRIAIKSILLVLGLLLFMRLVVQQSGYEVLVENQSPFPTDHMVMTLEGQQEPLSDYLKPEVPITVVSAWASWCGPCIREIPTLNRLHKNLIKFKKGRVLGVALKSGPPAKVKKVVEKTRMGYPVVVGTDQLFDAIGVRSFPVTYILDSRGVLRKKLLGQHNYYDLKLAVEEIIAIDRGERPAS